MRAQDEKIAQLAHYIRKSERICFFTGAGISTDSGIPDFRGPDGVWKSRKPIYCQDFMAREKSRDEYWQYYLNWWEHNRNAQPNLIHRAIFRLEQAGKVHGVVTQNIDGLHRMAGTSPELITELHGTNWEVECQSCLERSRPADHFEYVKRTGKAPVCACGGFLKAATISFGQNLRDGDMEKAFRLALESDCLIAMGSTLSVYPAASVPLEAARSGVPYIIVNHGETEHDGLPGLTLRVEGLLGEIFPRVMEKLDMT